MNKPRESMRAATLAVACLLGTAMQGETAAQGAREPSAYLGSVACGECHAKAFEAWRGSQHEQAMQEASPATVLGNFEGARFTQGGVSSRFFRRDGRYFVNTDGPDGKLADFAIRYTFGVYPLQQYLVELPGGRMQALGIAWDARPKTSGGQRWFHLYPKLDPKPGNPLHWTGIDQNWNYQCADCHSTNLRKNYDAATRTYKTTWSEVSVGCEACHGPGSRHVAWAKLDAGARRADATAGLSVVLDERRGVAWNTTDATPGTAARSKPRTSNREIETCARCHARRGQFSDAWQPGAALGDAFRAAMIEPGLYYIDGQMRDEVYNYGSFLQSRMHASGVTCSDCHEPHGQKLRAPGNAVCSQCHAPARFDTQEHHHHKPGTAGAACASCHMPTTTYMVVDPRHDHSMRIPRPDRSVSLGTPNACTQCHTGKPAKWGADAVARWYPQRKPGYQAFAEALAAGERGAPGASAKLASLVTDAGQPGIARASAIAPLLRNPGPSTLSALDKARVDPDPLVRAAALRALRDAGPDLRLKLLPPSLTDPVREVRMEAARGLPGETQSRLAAEDRVAFTRALDEFVAAAQFNADRPEGQSELGSLAAAQGQYEEALAAYRTALELDPTYAAASINLADLYRARGMEGEVERVLREAIKADSRAAAPRYALALSLFRQKRKPEGLASLADAARLDPDNARYAFVYGIALHDSGKPADAARVLEAGLARHPYDREILLALVSYERDAGQFAKAAKRAELLVQLEPGNPDFARLAKELAAMGRAPR